MSMKKFHRTSPMKEIEITEVDSASDKASSIGDSTTGISDQPALERSKTRKQ